MENKQENICDKAGRKHAYRWSGSIPMTGMYKCIYCGKPEDENTFNGKAMVYPSHYGNNFQD